MCEQCSSIAAAVRLGHVVEFPRVIGGCSPEQIYVKPLDEDD